MNPALGFQPLRILGEGSTRRAWSLPFGLTLKLERTDPLPPEEMARRGSRLYLHERRRTAIFNEMVVSWLFPRAVPRVFGVNLAFGPFPDNPAALIVEQIDSLAGENTPATFGQQADTVNRYGVHRDSLYICGSTGKLLVNDVHFCPILPEIKPGDKRWTDIPGGDEWIYAGNLGRGADGSLYLLDTGNISHPDLYLNPLTYKPTGKLVIELGLSASDGATWLERAAHVSRRLFHMYQHRQSSYNLAKCSHSSSGKC